MKYTVIKIKYFNHYIWFKTTSLVEEGGYLVGTSGWGKDGVLTNIKVKTDEVVSTITSENLQYR